MATRSGISSPQPSAPHPELLQVRSPAGLLAAGKQPGRPRGRPGEKPSGAPEGGDVVFRLERGATGFYDPTDGPPPAIDSRALRAAWHASARVAGGLVGEWVEQEYPRNYHTAHLIAHAVLHVALCHAHLPLIAFVSEQRLCYENEFLDPPAWSWPLVESGFLLLSVEQLSTPLSEVDTAVLTDMEWREVRFWGVTQLGGVLFHSWD